jgi:hypothetical protein
MLPLFSTRNGSSAVSKHQKAGVGKSAWGKVAQRRRLSHS